MTRNMLIIVEQREGKLNRVSWETIAAGQALAAETGWPVEAAVLGNGVASLASEVAGKKLDRVYAIDSAKLDPYTPDAFCFALKQFLETKQPKLVLMPHTYQVRDRCFRENLPPMLVSPATGPGL
jgi:electron transfer flavoprotein alpha subunit